MSAAWIAIAGGLVAGAGVAQFFIAAMTEADDPLRASRLINRGSALLTVGLVVVAGALAAI